MVGLEQVLFTGGLCSFAGSSAFGGAVIVAMASSSFSSVLWPNCGTSFGVFPVLFDERRFFFRYFPKKKRFDIH